MRCRAYRSWAPSRLWQRHVRRCAACQRYDAALRRVDAELRAGVAGGEARPELVEHVMQRVGQGRTDSPVLARLWPRYVAAAAVVALAAVAGMSVWLARPAEPTPEPTAAEMADWLAELSAYAATAERDLDAPLLRLQRDAEELIEPIQRYWPAFDQPPG